MAVIDRSEKFVNGRFPRPHSWATVAANILAGAIFETHFVITELPPERMRVGRSNKSRGNAALTKVPKPAEENGHS